MVGVCLVLAPAVDLSLVLHNMGTLGWYHQGSLDHSRSTEVANKMWRYGHQHSQQLYSKKIMPDVFLGSNTASAPHACPSLHASHQLVVLARIDQPRGMT